MAAGIMWEDMVPPWDLLWEQTFELPAVWVG